VRAGAGLRRRLSGAIGAAAAKSASDEHGLGPAHPEEAALIERIRAGDSTAMAGLCEWYCPKVLSLARAIAVQPDKADDLAQDAMLKAFRAFPSYRGEAPLGVWLKRIVFSTALDHRRRFIRESARLEPEVPAEADAARDQAALDALWADPSYHVDPEKVAQRAELAETLCSALLSLTEAQRRVIVLHDVHGLTSAEIAEVVASPVSTVKSHLRRGRMALVSRLDESIRQAGQ
jgi:RNA polymerase sigma-70 factor (ECF subfamily)